MLSSSINDLPVVEQNLQKAQGKWGRLVKIIGSEGKNWRMMGRFYVAVVQAVLIFGYETWVMTPWFDKSLESFHHRSVQRMTGIGHKRQQDGTWVYTPFGAVLATVGLEEIGVYIDRRHKTVAQFIATHTIMELFLAVERTQDCAYPGYGGSSPLWIFWG